MTDKIIGIILAMFILIWFAIFVTGCSGYGLDLTDQRTYIITKPPYQIIVSGDLTLEDKKAVRQIIGDLSLTDYKDYKFNEKINVSILGSETEIENINVKNGVVDHGEK